MMMLPSAVKHVNTARKYEKKVRKIVNAAQETAAGEDVSVDAGELAQHVDEHFDGHAEGGKAIVKGFKKVSERITDDGENVDDGIIEDSAEVLVGAVENVANSEVVQNVGEVAGPAIEVVHDALREGVKKGTEVVHGAVRAVVTPRGLPDIEDAEDRAERYAETIETQAEGLADSAAEAFGAVSDNAPAFLKDVVPSEALEDAVEELGETVAGALGEAAVEEAVETVAGSVPVVGAIIPSYYLLHGGAKTAAGATSLVAAGVMTLVGGVYGAAAAPFDGGASWGKVANTSRGVSRWGASVGAEGGLIAAKGAMGFADQIPGSQLATVPAKMACNMGANSINQMRNSSREDDVQGVEDLEGVVTEEMVKTGTAYEIFSADGQRLLRASGIKSSRCINRLGYVWGGYALTFAGPSLPPTPSAEAPHGHKEQEGQREEREQEHQEGPQEGLPLPPSSSAEAAAAGMQEEQHGQQEGQHKEQVEEEEHGGAHPSPLPSGETQEEQQDDEDQHGQHGPQDEPQPQQEQKERVREDEHEGAPRSPLPSVETQEEQQEDEDRSSSFSFSGSPGAYRLHSEMHGGNTLFFLGICYPAEWVVWDVPGKTDGTWERLELRWREGGKKFTISGHGGQHVRWKDSDGFFRGTRSESKATEFVLKEVNR